MNSIARNLIQRLDQAGFTLAKNLLAKSSWTVRDYLRALVSIPLASQGRYLSYCAQALEHFLVARGCPCVDVICGHFMKLPIIQQADHSGLLFDREVFLNNFMHALACREAGVHTMITLQCSTVCCLSGRHPITGPTFLRTRNTLLRVFPFSNRQLKNANFCLLPSPLTMLFEPMHRADNQKLKQDQFISHFIGKTFSNAPEAYRICNEKIWNSLNDTVTAVFTDDALTSEIVALHLSDRTSPIYRMLFDISIRDQFIKIKRQFVASKRNLAINRAAPDFFWYCKGHKLHPVVLIGFGINAYYCLEQTHEPLAFLTKPLDVVQALRSGLLYVDRLISYFARCLLPGVVAIGGTSQQDYVRHYQDIILECHHMMPFLDAVDIEQVERKDLSRLGGNPLLELNPEQESLIATLSPETDLEYFSNTFLDERIGDTIGTFHCASYLDSQAHINSLLET